MDSDSTHLKFGYPTTNFHICLHIFKRNSIFVTVLEMAFQYQPTREVIFRNEKCSERRKTDFCFVFTHYMGTQISTKVPMGIQAPKWGSSCGPGRTRLVPIRTSLDIFRGPYWVSLNLSVSLYSVFWLSTLMFHQLGRDSEIWSKF